MPCKVNFGVNMGWESAYKLVDENNRDAFSGSEFFEGFLDLPDRSFCSKEVRDNKQVGKNMKVIPHAKYNYKELARPPIQTQQSRSCSSGVSHNAPVTDYRHKVYTCQTSA